MPCTIKENFAFVGTPQASGLLARAHIINDHDAPAVARLRAAGAIPLGVTNTSELCMWMESFNKVYGITNNPYDPTRTVGGSSGGEGAIIGSGASPFGLGADVGGSIRMPAFFNGVFGHKPSPLLIPNDGQYPAATGEADRILGTGPLCRRAEDLELLVRVLAGDQAHRLRDPAGVDFARAARAHHRAGARAADERRPTRRPRPCGAGAGRARRPPPAGRPAGDAPGVRHLVGDAVGGGQGDQHSRTSCSAPGTRCARCASSSA